MPETGHMDVTALQFSDKNGKDSCVDQTILGHALEFGCGSVCSEPSEQKLEVVQSEQGEIKKERSIGDDEDLQLPSEDVNKFLVTEHLDPLSEDGSRRHTGMKSCDEPTNLVQGSELGSRSVSMQNHQLVPELESSLPVETRDIEQMAPPEDKTNDSLIEQLELPPVDVSKSSLGEADPCLKQVTSEQEHGVGSESRHSEPSMQKNQLAPEPMQNEIVEASSAASKCATVEQLGSPPETLTISSAVSKCAIIESTGVPLEDATRSEKSASPSEEKTKGSLIEQLELPPIDVSKSNMAEAGSCPQQIISEQRHEVGSGSVHSEPSEEKNQVTSKTEPLESETVETCQPPSEVLTVNSLCEKQGVPPEDVTKTPNPEQLAQPSENLAKDSRIEELLTSPKDTIDCFTPPGGQVNRSPKVLKKKHRVKPLVDSDRVLRPRSQEKPNPPELSTDLVNATTETKGEKKKKRQRARNVTADEFLRIRQRLRYFQNKINYERSLIDAYSGEGWKGLSLEKLKPEKELQRASSEILRQKLRIRDLFQHLDSLCAEGRIPESLFDSEGEIESEDIFCAKCGSKDVSLDNDIILCDGACERAFHQFCLEPPLRKEDIPPGDEGWLCPGCDCKVDCIDLLNESQGTNLSVTDSWEKVFPEAAVTAGQNQDPNFGLPSDDSEDDDYNPDGSETDDKVQEDVSGSDESQYTTASDDLEKPANEDQYLGLPSDDSEDDDYDPSAVDRDDEVKHESSSSDFTSDSEDLGAALDDGVSSGKDENPACSSLGSVKSCRGSDGRRSNVGRKKQFINEELSSSLKSDQAEEGAVPISGKRHVERLDYKKLYDEEYGNAPTDSSEDEIWTAKETQDNVSSDSSDDESWNDTVPQRKRNKTAGEATPVLLNGTAPVLNDETNGRDIKHDVIEPKHTSKKRTHHKMNAEETNGSPSTPYKDRLISGSSDKKAKSSANRRLGDAAVQELQKSFQENQYPDQATKERLASRLELTLQQVSKWFNNSRWSFRHASCIEPCSTACAARYRRKTPVTGKKDKPPQPGPEWVAIDATSNRTENIEAPNTSTVTPECSGSDPSGRNMVRPGSSSKKDSGKRKGTFTEVKDPRKRKGKSANVELKHDSNVEETQTCQAELPSAAEEPRGSKVQARRRKSIG